MTPVHQVWGIPVLTVLVLDVQPCLTGLCLPGRLEHPVTKGGVRPRENSSAESLWAMTVLNAELRSINSILT